MTILSPEFYTPLTPWPEIPFGLVRRRALRRALVVEDERKLGRFAARYRTVAVEGPTVPIDPLFNVNTPADVAEAERRWAAGSVRGAARLGAACANTSEARCRNR
jgi:hypothetical protein